MSNKTDFYDFMWDHEKRGTRLTDRELRDFQSTHPGFYWRKCGKVSHQVQFNRKEGWLSTESFIGNFESRMEKNLMNQVRYASRIWTTYGILAHMHFTEKLSASDLIDVGLLDPKELDRAISTKMETAVAKALKPIQATKTQLEMELSQKSAELTASNRALQNVTKERDKWVKLLKETIAYLRDRNTGITGVTKDQVSDLLRQLVNYLREH